MALMKYIDKKIRQAGLDQIDQINAIIGEYQRQGYKLTLRQLFYQLVSRGFIENTIQSYKNIGNLVNDGRMCGLIDWDAIEDRTREAHDAYGPQRVHEHNVNIRDIKRAVLFEIDGYYLHAWTRQLYYAEVWVEKSALEGIVKNATESYRVPYLATRGYPSVTLLKDAAERFTEHTGDGQRCVVIHLGDHDPSGIDMTRDIRDRLSALGAAVEVERIALNMEQIKRYSPPPNPAKETDTRAGEYIRRFGAASWELDALRPEVLSELVKAKIGGYFDREIYSEIEEHRQEGIEAMREKYRGLLSEIDRMAGEAAS
jgi:hypothetical protein